MTATLPDTDQHGLLLQLGADIQAKLGTVADELRRQRRERVGLNQFIYPIDIPAQQGVVTAGGVLIIAQPELLGPKTGTWWDVRRVTVNNFGSGKFVTLYKGSTGTAADQVPNNEITQITNISTNALDGVFIPGGSGLMVRPGEKLLIAGTGLSASALVTATWSVISVAEEYLGAYLL